MTTLWNDEPTQPVRHLRIVDLSIMLSGPFLTRLFVQHGADVIKVETLPAGDPLRAEPNAKLFDLLTAGKRSVGVQLKSPAGVELVKRMAAEADIFVEGFREGTMDGLGLGYPELSEENPDLIYLSLRGFAGRFASRPGHDSNFVATSGCGEWFLENGVPNYSAQFGDLVGGALVPAVKLLFHLANPNHSGMHLVCNADDGLRTLYLPRAYETVRAEEAPEEKRRDFGMYRRLDGHEPHSRYYRCRDGVWVSLQGVQPKHWFEFCDAIDRPQWKERHRDSTLVAEVEQMFMDAPSTYWEALCSNRETCFFRVIPWGEHLSFSQARSQLLADPFTWPGFPPLSPLRPCPKLGADTYSVMKALGCSNKELAEWIKAGVISGEEAP